MNVDRDTCEFIEKCVHESEKRTDLKIQLLDGKIQANDDKFKKSQEVVDLAKVTVDKHFEATNQYQARLDKQAATFATGKDVDDKIKLAVTGDRMQIRLLWGLVVTILILFIAEYVKSRWVG